MEKPNFLIIIVDETTVEKCSRPSIDGVQHCFCIKTIKTRPVSDQYEMYNFLI
jgi:hypothetical protein